MVIQVDEVYPSNSGGDMEVIEYVNSGKVKVRFLETGYEKYARAQNIRKGQVKDPYYPSVYNIGYLGEGPYKTRVGGKDTKAYATWANMLRRCYCSIAKTLHPTYRDCSVQEVWHNFQTFAKWYTEHYIAGLHLDKDIKVKGNKVYGPDTCMFVALAENNIAAHATTVVFRSPEGERVEVYNVSAFSIEKGLNQRHLSALNTGKRKTHKGWTLYKD